MLGPYMHKKAKKLGKEIMTKVTTGRKKQDS